MADWHEDFSLGPWTVSPQLCRISGGSQSINIKNKSMDVLVVLADAGGDVVTRDEILDTVWPGMAVTDDVLTQSIVELRKAFGDDARQPEVIETIPKVGIRLIATVVPVSADAEPESSRGGFVKYLLAAAAIVAVGVGLWAILDRQESARQPVIAVDETPFIAVLPFVNMSDDPESEYFADGVSEEIRSLLARVNGLKVIGRSSSDQFRGMDEDIRVIGQLLGVEAVVEGSVRKSGDQIRITAQLVDVADGSFIWVETYDRTMVTDVFEVQDDVAAAVIDALQVHVSTTPTRGSPSDNPEAISLYWRAISATKTADWGLALELLNDALELDPEYAEAWEMLAFVYWVNPLGTPIVESQDRMSEAAARAIALDPDLVLARTYYETSTRRPDMRWRTIDGFEKAARERPNDPEILENLTFLLTEFGYLDEAVTYAERLHELDPLSSLANTHLPLTLYAVGREDEALAALEFENQSDFSPQLYRWAVEGLNLVENRDETAIANVETWLEQNDYSNPGWFRGLVTNGRNPATGEAYLDQQIAAGLVELNRTDWGRGLTSLYMYFGFLDRYFDLVLASGPVNDKWHDAGAQLWLIAIFHGSGSTAHPDYLELAERLGVFEIWERRGAPDFCDKVDSSWVCE